MATKYKVSQEHNGKAIVYGNYPAADAEEAVRKAYNKQSAYNPFDFSRPFQIKRGSTKYEVTVNE